MHKPLFAGSNISRVKIHNLQAVLLSLLLNGSASRAQLAEETSLSNATITNLIAELIAQGLVIEEESSAEQQARRKRGVGRPRRMLHLSPDARHVVAVHVGIGIFRVGVANLRGDLVSYDTNAFDIDAPATKVLDQIAASATSTIQSSGINAAQILGVGVGVSGLVNHEAGINLVAPRLGWHHVPVAEHLRARLQLPVSVDNNVRAMALGEAFFGAGRNVDILAFIYGRIGVGAGFVVKGQVFRGSGAGAGEIGHTVLIPAWPVGNSTPHHETLETLVSETVLVERARAIARLDPEGVLANYLASRPDGDPAAGILAAARAGEKVSLQLFEQQAYFLGVALANLVNVLNPELILLGGLFAQGHDLILPRAEATMKAYAFGGLGEKVRLEATGFGQHAGLIGAAALALSQFFYRQPVVQ